MPKTVHIGAMPAPPKLRVLSKGSALVPDYEAMNQRIRRFHGWKHDPKEGPEFIDPETQQRKNHGAFVSHSEVVELPVTPEYIRHLRDGDLWPADERTAQACGLKFDPEFGGEHEPTAGEEH